MNTVSLIGRLTRDPDVRYGAGTQTACARFTIAIDRGKDRSGNDLGADFPGIVCFGKTAELCERYLKKGRLVGIQGRIQTGKYEKNGQTIYTTDVIADRVEFLDWGDRSDGASSRSGGSDFGASAAVPGGFEPLKDDGKSDFSQLTDDDIPF